MPADKCIGLIWKIKSPYGRGIDPLLDQVGIGKIRQDMDPERIECSCIAHLLILPFDR